MGNGEWGGKRGIETIYFFNRVNTPAQSAIGRALSCFRNLVVRTLSTFGFRVDFDIEGIFIDPNVQDVWLAAHLAVFNVGLLHPSAHINKCRGGFAAIGAVIISG